MTKQEFVRGFDTILDGIKCEMSIYTESLSEVLDLPVTGFINFSIKDCGKDRFLEICTRMSRQREQIKMKRGNAQITALLIGLPEYSGEQKVGLSLGDLRTTGYTYRTKLYVMNPSEFIKEFSNEFTSAR